MKSREAEKEPWPRKLEKIRFKGISKFLRRYYAESPLVASEKEIEVKGVRPFPHSGNWCQDDELVNVELPLNLTKNRYTITLRLKWWNLRSRWSSQSKPELIVARAFTEMRMTTRIRTALEKKSKAEDSLIPMPHGALICTSEGEYLLQPVERWKSIGALDSGDSDQASRSVVVTFADGKQSELPPIREWDLVLGISSYTEGVEDWGVYLDRQMERDTYEAQDEDQLRTIVKMQVLIRDTYSLKLEEDRTEARAKSEEFVLLRASNFIRKHPLLSEDEALGFYQSVFRAVHAIDYTDGEGGAWGDLYSANLLMNGQGRMEPTDPQTDPHFSEWAHVGLDSGFCGTELWLRYRRSNNPAFKKRIHRYFDLCEEIGGMRNVRVAVTRTGIPLACSTFFNPRWVRPEQLKERWPVFKELHRMIQEGKFPND